MSWHVEEEVSPLQLISAQHPRTVRLTRTDGSRVVLDEPRIAAGDSLVGVHYGVPSSVAVSDVTQVATRRVSPGKTIGLFLGLSTVVVGAAVIACLSSDCIDNWGEPIREGLSKQECSITQLAIEHLVAQIGASGFEPPTSWSRTRRANRAALRPELIDAQQLIFHTQLSAPRTET